MVRETIRARGMQNIETEKATGFWSLKMVGLDFGPEFFYQKPSGYVNSLLLKMAMEIVDFPINSMVIFHSYVKLPEGNYDGFVMI